MEVPGLKRRITQLEEEQSGLRSLTETERTECSKRIEGEKKFKRFLKGFDKDLFLISTPLSLFEKILRIFSRIKEELC